MSRAIVAALLALPLLLAISQAQQRYNSPTAGIAVTPPAGWNVVSMQQVMQNRSKVRLPDSELQAGIQRATAPLFVFAKYPEPHTGLNPTVQIVLRPSPSTAGVRPTTVLAGAIQTLQQAYPDFRFVDPIQDTSVSGMPAAYVKASYTLRTQQGNAHPILARMWLVPRGAYMFLIGMSGATEGADVSEREFATALASIEIQP